MLKTGAVFYKTRQLTYIAGKRHLIILFKYCNLIGLTTCMLSSNQSIASIDPVVELQTCTREYMTRERLVS